SSGAVRSRSRAVSVSSRLLGDRAPSIGGIGCFRRSPERSERIISIGASMVTVPLLGLAGAFAPVTLTGYPVGVRAFQFYPADAVVLQTTQVEVAAIFAHGGQGGVGFATGIP